MDTISEEVSVSKFEWNPFIVNGHLLLPFILGVYFRCHLTSFIIFLTILNIFLTFYQCPYHLLLFSWFLNVPQSLPNVTQHPSPPPKFSWFCPMSPQFSSQCLTSHNISLVLANVSPHIFPTLSSNPTSPYWLNIKFPMSFDILLLSPYRLKIIFLMPLNIFSLSSSLFTIFLSSLMIFSLSPTILS